MNAQDFDITPIDELLWQINCSPSKYIRQAACASLLAWCEDDMILLDSDTLERITQLRGDEYELADARQLAVSELVRRDGDHECPDCGGDLNDDTWVHQERYGVASYRCYSTDKFYKVDRSED